MFERFTDEARQVVVAAQHEARRLKHNYIGTEHLLLGLLRDPEAVAGQVLGALGVRLEVTREQIVRIVQAGEETSSAQIPFTPRAKNVLELALREALALGHNYIGPEHILLGLVRENEGMAARVLLDVGIEGDAVRDQVIRQLSGSVGTRPSPPMPGRRQGRMPVDDAWLEGLAARLEKLADEIRHHLDVRRGPEGDGPEL